MNKINYLLSDEQVIHYITRGYVVLKSSLCEEVHKKVLDKITFVTKEETNPGNNILPRVPELQTFFDDPIVDGALTSILGSGYFMSPHRHCHTNLAGSKMPLGWHKDGYWSSMRNHLPWWAMILYYTQDVTEDMGPTCIIPGSQYFEKYPGDHAETRMPCGKAGTMVLIHFDLWHTATQNNSQIDRFMLKFQFNRLQAPNYPSWNYQSSRLTLPESVNSMNPHKVIWNYIWDWMLGAAVTQWSTSNSADTCKWLDDLSHPDALVRTKAADELGLAGLSATAAVPSLAQALVDDHEPLALNAAYALGRMGMEGVEVLLQTMLSGNIDAAIRAVYGLCVAKSEAVLGLIDALSTENDTRRGLAANALGMIGNASYPAVPTLIRLVDDGSVWVRRSAAEALGMIKYPLQDTIPALIRLLEVNDNDVKSGNQEHYFNGQGYILNKVAYTAAFSLLKLGKEPETKQAVHALKRALINEDRYVRAFAAEALAYIRSEEAVDILIDYFRTSHWCDLTNSRSPF